MAEPLGSAGVKPLRSPDFPSGPSCPICAPPLSDRRRRSASRAASGHACTTPDRRSSPRTQLFALDLADRPVVVIGGGTTAQERLAELLSAGAAVTVIAPGITPAIESLVWSGHVTWLPRRYRRGDLADAWIALVCTRAPDVDSEARLEAIAGRIFYAGPEDEPLGSLRPTANARRDDEVVAVLAPDPARARSMCTSIQDARRSGTITGGPHRGRRLHGVAIVGGGPGDPQLITVRARDVLRRADTVVVTAPIPWSILRHAPRDAELVDASTEPAATTASQRSICRTLVGRARGGRLVVSLAAGDPFLLGSGHQHMAACDEADVPVTVAPGVTNTGASLAMARSVTYHLGMGDVSVVAVLVPPTHPDNRLDWSALARRSGALVLLDAIHVVADIAAVLIAGGRHEDAPVEVVSGATSDAECIVSATLRTVGDVVTGHDLPASPFVVIESDPRPQNKDVRCGGPR